MDARINPFAPGAGSPPPELAGRGPILDHAAIALDRLRNGLHAKSMILVGLRGVGKTVVLNRIHMLAQEAGYQAAFIEAHEGKTLAELLLPALRQVLYTLNLRENVSEKTRKALRVLRSFLGGLGLKAKASLGEMGGSFSRPPPPHQCQRLRKSVTRFALPSDRASERG